MKKIIFGAVAVVLITLFLVTCDDWLNAPVKEDAEGEVEYFDWQYEEQPDGGGLLTLMLDGSTPFAHVKQNQRALSLDLAKMSHDYFEAVFICPGTTTTIARAAWEIGTSAGISGVARDITYSGLTVGAVNATTGSAIIFVGKKTGKTLLGIGHIVRADSTWNTQVIASTTKSVTFGVYPLTTFVGLGFPAGYPLATSPANPTAIRPTFWTAPGASPPTDNTATLVDNVPLQKDVLYPKFELPEIDVATFDPANPPVISAVYTFGGLDAADADSNPGIPTNVSMGKPSYLPALILAAELEIIKRTPLFLYKGQTYEAITDILDTYTKVEATNNDTAGDAFANPITMKFTQGIQSAGIFAITFQVPVYAITPNPVDGDDAPIASSNGGPPATRWYIRPGYNQYQFLLDDGIAAGGAVLLGTGTGGVEWLEIFTVGIGFSN